MYSTALNKVKDGAADQVVRSQRQEWVESHDTNQAAKEKSKPRRFAGQATAHQQGADDESRPMRYMAQPSRADE